LRRLPPEHLPRSVEERTRGGAFAQGNVWHEQSLHKFVRHFDGRSSHLFPTHSGWGPSGKTGLPTRKNCGPPDFRKQPSPSALRVEKFSENKPGLFCSAGRAASSRAPCTGVNGPRPHRGKAPVSPWIKKFPSRHRAMLRRATRGRLQEVPELTRGFMGATTPIATSPNHLKKIRFARC
jgi:hypothetical protein